MKPFMGEDFLLQSETAKRLYFEYAKDMPLMDYHCHIKPSEIYENKRFEDLAEAWLAGDHYKWRLMRANGVEERCITGDASGWEKFLAFAQTLTRAPGNPVYHWAHLELQRYFGCYTPLSEKTAKEVWDYCNRQIETNENLRVRGIIKQSKLTTIVTTDDPLSDLEWHKKLKEDESFDTAVYPGWRPDSAINIHKDGYIEYIKQLSRTSGLPIHDYDCLLAALSVRMDYFAKLGCRASDHGVDAVEYAPASRQQLNAIVQKRLKGEELQPQEQRQYRSNLLLDLARQYAKRGWVMEIHFGVLRSINTNMYNQLGPDTGFDCINPDNCMSGFAQWMDTLEQEGNLPKTLIFPINPTNNTSVVTLAGCFYQAGVRSKVQQGSAWWFNDTKHGMQQQMRGFAEGGLLGNFIGMLTDSRSFLSYTRHEYFRRILCDLLGGWIESGEYPNDLEAMGALVQDICYNNAMKFFGYK